MVKKTLLTVIVALGFSVVWPLDVPAAEVTPETVAGATTIDAAKAKELFDTGAVFVDPRNDADFEAGRIPGAEHLDLNGQLSAETLAEVVGKEEPVVFYCNGEKCSRSPDACEKAVGWGWKQVYFFRTGLPAWKAAGYPVE